MEANNDAAGEAEDDILSELRGQEGNDNVLAKSASVDEAKDEVVQQFPIAIDVEEDKQDLEANNDVDMDDLD
jgi:hypothetical protein